jgi:twinkle protein
MIFKLTDYAEDLSKINQHGLPAGMDLGFETLKEHYRPERGYMTIVTGIPGHGKSEVIDAFMVNLAHKYGWKFAVYSPENYPIALHSIKLAEKYIGMAYRDISSRIKKDVHDWIDQHFSFIYPSDDDSTLLKVLGYVKQIQNEFGCDGFVIDPWNEIDHRRPTGLTETEYISQALTKVRRFARENQVHSWLVAHPTKLRKNDNGGYDPPTPYDISGSSHWRNKADFCLTMHRDDMTKNEVSVIVQKVKQKHFGRLGKVKFDYDYLSGRIRDQVA